MVGLLKGLLMLQEGKIPPSLHFETPNPNIDFAGLGLCVPTRLEPLPGRRRAVIGVNSFGFGGTNATVLLGAAPAPKPQVEPAGGRLPPLLLSARSAAGLTALAAAWRDRLATTPAPALPALLRGAARHRGPWPHRLALRGADPSALAEGLAAWEAGEAGAAAQGAAAPGQGVAFVFSGNGAPFAGMAQAQLAANPDFAAGVAAADAALAPLLGWSVTDRLAAGVTAADLAASDIAQPLLFAVQHGIVAALAAQGIRPALCLGHSVGEVAAAAAAGMLELPEAARLVAARSRHQARTRGQGRMAALGASAEAALPVLDSLGTLDGRGIKIAAINAPESLTVAGPAPLLARLEAVAAERRWSFLTLDLDYAFHSSAMDGLREGLLADLAGLRTQPPQRPLISTVTGAPLDPAACGPEHWWHNLRAPVQFLPAVRAAAGHGPCLFLEIGPNPVLQGYLRDSLRAEGAEAAILPSLSRRDPAADPFPAIADRAWAAGADPRQGPAFAGPAARRGLPHTPFERQRVWFGTTVEAVEAVAPPADHPLLGFRRGPDAGHWSRHIDTTLEPWLADHRLAGEPVLPAAAMWEMALAAGRARHPDATAIELREAAIHAALPLEAGHARELRAVLDEAGRFTLESRRRLAPEPWTLHLEATVAALPALPALPATAPSAPAQGMRLEGEAIRRLATTAGLHYGPAFESLDHAVIEPAAGRAAVRLRRPDAAPADDGFLLHPARLDGALQGLVGLLTDGSMEAGTGIVPVRIARLVVRTGAAPAEQADITLASRGERSAAADLLLRDAAGAPVAVLEGCTLQRIRLPGRADPAEAAFRVELLPAPPLPGQPAGARPALGPCLAAAQRQDAALELGEATMLLEGFCAAAAHAALSAAPASGPQAHALLAALAEGGLAAPGPAGLRPVPTPDLPPAEGIWRQVLLEQPALAPDLAWAALAAERLPAVLADWQIAAELALTEGPPANSAGQARLGAVLAEAVAAFAAAWPSGLPLRVLEVGAGPGPLTARLAAALAASGRSVRFTAAGLPGRPGPATPPAMPGLDYAALPWDPLGAEPPPLAADLVIGLGAGARLRAGALLPEALRQAAAPGAALLLVEPLPNPLFDLCCGQDPAWWSGPGGTSPLPAATGWEAALAHAGWGEAASTMLSGAPWPAVLLATRAPEGAAVLAAPKLRRIALFADAAMGWLRGPLAALLQSRGATVAAHDLAEAARTPPAALQGSLVVALAGGGDALAASLTALGRLAAAAEGAAQGFRLVTAGGQQPEAGTHDPAAAACFALGRVLANEHPGLKPRRIDLDPGLTPEAAARRLAGELLAEGDAEAEVTLTRAARLVPRLRPGLPPAPPPAGPAVLRIGQPGQLGTLRWAPLDLPSPGPGEVAIRIEAAGVNFRDLMWAQGLLPEEALLPGFAGPGLGMECAGVVEAAGAGVPFAPGERVFGVAPRALATHAVTRAEALAALPDGIDPAAAATVPVAFLTARWLAAQGVRHLALLSRRGAETPGVEAAIRDLAAHGAKANLITCDATDAAALDRALRGIRAAMPPIRGVVHAAAVMADGAAAAMEAGRAARVLAAKLAVAESLDALTAGDPLALFLMFGSATVAVGNPGQGAYVAANAALEALARRRRAAGRPASVIAWGPIADAGMLAGEAGTAEILCRRLGATALPAEEALTALPALLEAGPAVLGHARLAWGEARAALAVLDEPSFEAVRSAAAPAGDAGDLRARLRAAQEAEALALLREALAAELGSILRLPPAAVTAEAPLGSLGLDSLGGMELRLALEQRLGMPVPLSAVTDTLTVDSLAHRLAEALRSGPSPEETVAEMLIAAHEPTLPPGPSVKAA
jgi:acyl transferase domain-containing protein/acyl carrier protein